MQSTKRHYDALRNFAGQLRVIFIKYLKFLKKAWSEKRSCLSLREQLFFVQRLSFLLKAQIPLAESLSMMRAQSSSIIQKNAIDALLSDVLNGHYLYASLSRAYPSFGLFAITLIRVGETGGILGKNLEHLYQELKKKNELKRKVIGALFYPGLIVCTTLGVASMLMFYLFPKILPVIKSMGIEFPVSTQILVWFYSFWQMTRWWLVLALIITVVVCTILLRREIWRVRRDTLLIRLPLLGTVLRQYQVGTFCRTLGLLLCSEVKVGSALEITAESMSNLWYRAALFDIQHHVMRGETISKNLERYPYLFPSVVSQLVAIGESTADLSHSFLSLADMYESEMDELARTFAQTLEPALMIILGLIIGFVAIAIITPFYAITQKLHP